MLTVLSIEQKYHTNACCKQFNKLTEMLSFRGTRAFHSIPMKQQIFVMKSQ